MRISIIGCGHIGLVTGACLSQIGHQIVCTDKNSSLIEALNAGQSVLYEQYLDRLIAERRADQRLRFTTDSAEAIRCSEAIFLCVGVPQMHDGEADASAIESVVRLIAAVSDSDKIVVIRSGAPVGTGQKIRRILDVYSRGRGVKFRVAVNPQFLKEGSAVADFLHPDRILVGVGEAGSGDFLRDLYRPILDGRFVCPIHSQDCPEMKPSFVVANIASAELIKQVANSFLAMKISYVNMVSDLCEKLGGDIQQVAQAIGFDRRIGSQFLNPGIGFGGARLPRDLRALCRLADQADVDMNMLKEAERINCQRIDRFVDAMRRSLWVMKEKQIAVLGLAAKPGTDDVRFSPALELLRRLVHEGAQLRAYDPEATLSAELPDAVACASPYEAAEHADAIVIATEWPQFRDLDWHRIRELMERPLIFDGRNLLGPREMKAIGFEYVSVGRPV